MKLWLYRDRSNWHRHLASVAERRGIPFRVFADPTEPDEGIVFARLHHHPDVRERDKGAMAYMASNRELTLVPGYRAAMLYDDKVEQARELAKWMPRQAIVYSAATAEQALEVLGLPLMSKSAEGAGSFNVRLIKTRADAEREISQAFSAGGIPLHYAQRQEGYLLWQRFLPGNDYDFRVIVVGRELLILRRGNRSDRPMASGSGFEMPITFPDAEAESVLEFAVEFFAAEGMNFCGIDIVRDRDNDRWALLECTTGWPLGKNDMHRTVGGRSWGQFFDIIVDEMEAGRLGA